MKRLVRVIALFVFCLASNVPMAVAHFSAAGVQKFKIPVEAPDFTLKELGGSKISLREFRGKVVLLNFFAVR